MADSEKIRKNKIQEEIKELFELFEIFAEIDKEIKNFLTREKGGKNV